MPRRPATILGEALEQTADRREAFIREQCGEDTALRAEVMDLLAAFDRASGFLHGSRDAGDDATEAGSEAIGTRIGRYKLLQKIGEGGFGTVYMAEQVEPVRRRVALKVVKPGMDTRQVLARFEAERQALAMMDHTNIARVLDGGATEEGRPYFVMELVRGVPITEFCDANTLSTPERLRILIDVIGAVQHAHQKGVIHRDLKPTNVLVTLHEGRPVPKVIDFGIAKAISTPLTDKTVYTEFRSMVGTPQYMSPEQAEMSGLDVDTRTDVYALGVMLYELLTGAPPFSAGELRQAGLAEMQRVIREVDPPRPSVRLSTLGRDAEIVARSRAEEPASLSRLVRGDLDWIVMTALEKDRQRRYPTAAELAADLTRYLADEPVNAAPPSTLYRLRKLARRHRVAVGAGAAVAVALLLGAAMATAFAVDSARNLDAAQAARAEAEREGARAREAASLADARAEENARLLYAMSLRAAETAIRNGDLEESRRLLESTEPEERGWEWTWVDGVATDRGHEIGRHAADGVRDLEYSADGRLLVSTGYDGAARIWDAHSHALLHTLGDHAEGDVVTGASFSPDGTRLATCSADRVVKVWNLETGQELKALGGHTSWLSSVAFDPTGRWLATAGGNSNLRLWDAETLELIESFGGYTHDVWSIDFSPDGRRLATCTGDGWIVVWDLETRTRALERRVGSFGLWSVRYSPDGRTLAVAGFDNRASVWDATTGQLLHDLRGYNLPVRVAEFSPDGLLIVTGGHGAVRSFRADTGEPVAEALSSQGDLHALAFHPSGRSFAVGGGTPDVRRWDLAHLSGPVELVGHERLIFESVTDPTGRLVYSVGQDGSLRSWDALTGATRWVRFSSGGGFFSIDITRDGATVVTTSGDGMLRSWDAETGVERWSRAVGGRSRNVRISPDGRLVAAGASEAALQEDSTGGTAALWSLDDGRELHVLRGHAAWLARMDFDPTATRLATTSSDGSVIIWNTEDGSILQRLAAGTEGHPNSIAFAPDGARLFVGQTDGKLVIWDLEREAPERVIAAHNSTIGSVRCTRDGRRLLTSAWHNPEVRIWHADTGERLLEIDSRTTGLSDAAFLPDESGLITAGMEGRLRIWELDPPVGAQSIRSDTLRSAIDRQVPYRRTLDALENASKEAAILRRAWRYPDASAILGDALGDAERTLDPAHPLINRLRRELAWTAEVVEAIDAPVVLSADRLARFAGEYGRTRIRVDDGVLIASNEDLDEDQVLLPIDEHTFQSRLYEWVRVRFVVDDDDRPVAVIGYFLDGGRQEFPRTGPADASG